LDLVYYYSEDIVNVTYTLMLTVIQLMENKDIRLFRPIELFGSKNTEEIRKPFFDVGEFLPSVDKGYQEIARICLSSSTGDVISIRAKKAKNGYDVEVVNEYETEFIEYEKKYELIPTQGEIFNVIRDMNTESDSQYYWIQIVEMNELKTINEITDFIYIDSNIYPDLNELLIHFFKQNEYK